MTIEKIRTILEKHQMWIKNEKNGERADLYGANLCGTDLRGADLCGADLYGANLYGANLCGTDLRGANLCGTDLRGTDLRGANLYGANLYGANLYGANLYGANLCGTDLRGANLYGANLRGADLCGANLYGADLCGADLYGAKNVPYIPMTCPDTGAFIGWKIAGSKIIKLQIPEDAKRSSATGRKCRCDKAIVLAIENIDGSDSGLQQIESNYDSNFLYRVGETVSVDDFDMDRFNECAPGIHFFINRQEAVEY